LGSAELRYDWRIGLVPALAAEAWRWGIVALFVRGLVELLGNAALWAALPLVLLVAGAPTPYVVIGAVVQIASLLTFAQISRRRMIATRNHLSFADFEAEFANSGCEPAAIEAAYADISTYCGYPIRRHDLMQRTLGFHPEDFEDLGRARLKKLGVLDLDRSPYLEASTKMASVDEYVRFLSYVVRSEREKLSHRFDASAR